jgi:hypothetical protein
VSESLSMLENCTRHLFVWPISDTCLAWCYIRQSNVTLCNRRAVPLSCASQPDIWQSALQRVSDLSYIHRNKFLNIIHTRYCIYIHLNY